MRVVGISLVLAAAFAAPVSAQSFVGEWRATATVPDGEVSETVIVTRTADGYSIVTKDVEPPPADGTTAGPGLDIKLEGDNFSYKRIAQTPGGPVEIFYKGTVSGETFTGTGEIMGFSVPYNGVRLNEAE